MGNPCHFGTENHPLTPPFSGRNFPYGPISTRRNRAPKSAS